MRFTGGIDEETAATFEKVLSQKNAGSKKTVTGI